MGNNMELYVRNGPIEPFVQADGSKVYKTIKETSYNS